MGAILRRTWGGLLAAVTGGILALCFPPFGMGGLVWVGMMPLMVALWAGGGRKRRGWYRFRMGWIAGAVFWVINLNWLTEVSSLGVWAVGLSVAVYVGLWGAFAAGAGNPWKKNNDGTVPLSAAGRSLGFAVLNAGMWCGFEWVRGWMLTGFGWNGLGVTFHETPVIAQSADLVGVTGLAFLPVFLAAVLVQVGQRLHGEVRAGRLRPHWDFGIAATLIAVVFLYGVMRLHFGIKGETRPVDVLLVQLNIPQEASRALWTDVEIHNGYEEETLKAFAALEERNAQRMEEALKEGESGGLTLEMPDWVMWPEASLRGWLVHRPDGSRDLAEFSQQTINTVREAAPFTLVMGLNEVVQTAEDQRSYNSLVALPEDADLLPVGLDRFLSYRKQHLVMFGETIPYVDKLKFLAWLYEQSAGVPYQGSFDVGEGHDPMRIPHAEFEDGVPVIPSICFEDTVPRLLRKFVQNGGQVIVNVTNDGWFKESEAAAQHFANARFRCIEFRRPMIRCSNTGVSAVVGVTGSVAEAGTDRQQILVDEEGSPLTRGWLMATAQVPVDGPLTLYARFGDWFAVLGLVAGFGWWVTGRWRGRRLRTGD